MARAKQACPIQCALKLTSTDFGFPVGAKVEYTDPMTNSVKFINVAFNLTVSDFLRPVPGMAVAQFGQQWQTPGMVERKLSIPNSTARSAEAFMQKCQMFGIQPIQAIGTEAVAVGKLISLNMAVLMHGKTGPALEVLIRTSDKTLSETLQAAVRNGGAFN